MTTLDRLVSRSAALVAGAALVVLGGCDGSGADEPSAQCPSAASFVATAAPGPTPFIAFLSVQGAGITGAESFRFTVAPKPAATSKPVDVTYAAAALKRDGYVAASADTVTVPVFGLYAAQVNSVSLHVRFSASCSTRLDAMVTTPAYTDVAGVLTRPTVLKARSPSATLGFDYILLKTRAYGPAVIDTDGEVRWVSPIVMNGFSSALLDNGLIVGDNSSTALRRVGWDGRIQMYTLPVAHYTAFHHNIERGKFGLLAEMDGISGGVPIVESILAEISHDGALIKEWDMATVFEGHMRAAGDDPSAFVRSGTDWFHMNSAMYDSRDDSLLVSSRENFVAKLDYATGKILWIFGDPTKYWYQFPSLRAKAILLEGDGLYPIGQHALSVTADGNLMLFNNGAPSFFNPQGTSPGQSRNFSAVSTYAIDPVNLTAREVRRFDHDKSVLSDVCSSAYETAQGSTLINYSAAAGRTRSRVLGVDAAGQIVFDLEYLSPQTCATSWNAIVVPLQAMELR